MDTRTGVDVSKKRNICCPLEGINPPDHPVHVLITDLTRTLRFPYILNTEKIISKCLK
jgi:hypothetical protein